MMKAETPRAYRIQPVRFAEHEVDIRAVREAVFIVEQGIPAELEWDTQDAIAQHVLAYDNQHNPVGTARMLVNGRIGRMAVLAPWRRQGVGGAMLVQLLDLARAQGLKQVYLSAQSQALPFYQRHGFKPKGQTYQEVGILHQKMTCRLR
jgi:predicted GNAT family N-acyltransferase